MSDDFTQPDAASIPLGVDQSEPAGHSPSSTSRRNHSSEEERPENLEDRDSKTPKAGTTIIGVSRAGKTFLVAALQQACMLSGGNGYELSFIPLSSKEAHSRSTSDLIREVIQRIATGDPTLVKSDVSVSRYSFQLACQSSWFCEPSWLGKTRISNMTVVDGPGGSLFPVNTVQGEREFERDMIASIMSSTNLVICIDSVNPQLTVFRREFSQLLQQATSGLSRRLNANRVLLLFTKVDAVVDRVLRTLPRALNDLGSGEISTSALRLMAAQYIVTEQRLAELIHPIEFARSTLDQASLSLIRRSLKREAQMAVGICSSTGFYEDGSPFWDDSESKIRRRRGQSFDDPLRDWRPFGVEEAIIFLLTGRTGATLRDYDVALDRQASVSRPRNQLRLVMRRNDPPIIGQR